MYEGIHCHVCGQEVCQSCGCCCNPNCENCSCSMCGDRKVEKKKEGAEIDKRLVAFASEVSRLRRETGLKILSFDWSAPIVEIPEGKEIYSLVWDEADEEYKIEPEGNKKIIMTEKEWENLNEPIECNYCPNTASQLVKGVPLCNSCANDTKEETDKQYCPLCGEDLHGEPFCSTCGDVSGSDNKEYELKTLDEYIQAQVKATGKFFKNPVNYKRSKK